MGDDSGSTPTPPPATPRETRRARRVVALSRRQQQVLALVAAGHSDTAVAELLGTSVPVAVALRRAAFRATGVTSRPQARLWLQMVVDDGR